MTRLLARGASARQARVSVALVAVIALGFAARVHAQRSSTAAQGAPSTVEGRGGGPAQPVQSPRVAAPIDLTGYWVAIVTQDWRWRMVTPAKGDYQGVQMTPEARKIADSWDPAKDESADEQCRSYGAPALMSVPGRLHITWQDDNTLKVETDAGMQTRLLQFSSTKPSSNPPRSWQGVSVAQWQTPRPNVPLLLRPAERISTPSRAPARGVTARRHHEPARGHLRKNGVPYSENAVLTEHWDLSKLPSGEEWLTITTQVDDPQDLRNPRLVAPPFKKEPDTPKGSDSLLCEVVIRCVS